MIRAVGFDLDGTLYPNYKMILNSVPFFLSHPRTAMDFISVRKAARNLGLVKDFRLAQAELLASRRHIETTTAYQRIEKFFYDDWEKVIARISAYADLIPFLDKLKAKGIRLAVMSDFPPVHKLQSMGLASYFEFAFCSEDAGTLKPHSAAFQLLATRFGFPESDVLYVGNSRRNDISGAKAAGMKTAYLGRKECKDADIVFDSYHNLYEKISLLF